MTATLITFGSFTPEEAQQLLKDSTLKMPSNAIIFGSFTEYEANELLINSTICLPKKTIMESNDFSPILIKVPDNDAIVCKRCYMTNHYTYDCFSKRTISGVLLQEKKDQVIIRINHHGRRNKNVNHASESEAHAQQKTTSEIYKDAEISSSLQFLYWATQCHMLNHAQAYIANSYLI
jgi:hypothetical protein